MNHVVTHATLSLMDHRVDEVFTYLSLMSEALKAEADKWEAWIDEWTRDLPPQRGNEIAEQYAGDYSRVTDDFPSLLSQSCLVAIWSYFERTTVLTCRRSARKRIDDWTATRIESGKPVPPQALKQFEDEIDDIHSVPKAEEYWQRKKVVLPAQSSDLNQIRHVRNMVVHSSGRRSKQTKNIGEIEAYLVERTRVGKPGLAFKGDDLIVSPAFCEEAMILTEAYTRAILTTVAELDPGEYCRDQCSFDECGKRCVRHHPHTGDHYCVAGHRTS